MSDKRDLKECPDCSEDDEIAELNKQIENMSILLNSQKGKIKWFDQVLSGNSKKLVEENEKLTAAIDSIRAIAFNNYDHDAIRIFNICKEATNNG